jgi:hypothetical protein
MKDLMRKDLMRKKRQVIKTFKELGRVLNIPIQPRYRVMTLGFLKITYKIYLEQENHNNNKG